MYGTAARNATLPRKPVAAFARHESQLPVAVETRPKRSIKPFYNRCRLQWKENASITRTKSLTVITYFLFVEFLVLPKIKAIWGKRVYSVFEWVRLIPVDYYIATETSRLGTFSVYFSGKFWIGVSCAGLVYEAMKAIHK
jgi:hypothetical protein